MIDKISNLFTRHPRAMKAIKSAGISGAGAGVTIVLNVAGIVPGAFQGPVATPLVVAGVTWLINTVRNLLKRIEVK